MKKTLSLLSIILFAFLTSFGQDTYDVNAVYSKGDQVKITINGVQITVEYVHEQPSSNFPASTPYNTSFNWLWAVPAGYSGDWVAYKYLYSSTEQTIVSHKGYLYSLKQEIWADAPSPDLGDWAWKCENCDPSAAETCPAAYTTGFFPLNVAQQNNGADNTGPVNDKGEGRIMSNGMIRLDQERMCQTPLPLYNNDIYLRDPCDPYAGLGYYGHADNRDVATPQKRYFADHDIDGPVLYGWNGGALGVRQRANWDTKTGLTTEKVALQWTPSEVIIGTELSPLPLELYAGVFANNISGSRYGFYVSGTNSRLFRAYNPETKKVVFNVSGNGDVAIDGNLVFKEELKIFKGNTECLKFSYDSEVTSIQSPNNTTIALNPNGGAVAIGNVTPCDYDFAVAGKMVAEAIWVKQESDWPDFVFEPTYELSPLSEVEAFIEENKHLPNVPSVKDVEKDGISLGEMNAILLQKIEELTLYMIQQEKRVKELENLLTEKDQ